MCAVRADDAHGANPVGRDLGHQGVEHLQTGGIHYQDLRVVAVAEETALTLGADGELVELEREREREREREILNALNY